MTPQQQEQVLRSNTALFLSNAAQCFKDLVNADFTVESSRNMRGLVIQEHGFVVVAHFSGRVQGDFLFSTTEMTAAKIAGVYPADHSLVGLIKGRVVFADTMREVLNVSSQMTLSELSKSFGTLTLLPSSWVFGELHMADFVSGIGVIGGRCGRIQCGLILNMASIQGMDDSASLR